MPLVVVCIVVSFGKKSLLPVKEEAAAPHSHNEKKREVEMALGANRRILEKLGWGGGNAATMPFSPTTTIWRLSSLHLSTVLVLVPGDPEGYCVCVCVCC